MQYYFLCHSLGKLLSTISHVIILKSLFKITFPEKYLAGCFNAQQNFYCLFATNLKVFQLSWRRQNIKTYICMCLRVLFLQLKPDKVYIFCFKISFVIPLKLWQRLVKCSACWQLLKQGLDQNWTGDGLELRTFVFFNGFAFFITFLTTRGGLT